MYLRIDGGALVEADAPAEDGLSIAIGAPGDVTALCAALPGCDGALREVAGGDGAAGAMDVSIAGACVAWAVDMPEDGSGFAAARVSVVLSARALVILATTDAARAAAEAALRRDDGHALALDRLLCRLLAGLVRGDMRRVEALEAALSALEEDVLDNRLEGFAQAISPLRRQVREMRGHYERMEDIADALVENALGLLGKESLFSLKRMQAYIQRLSGNMQLLRDYALQVQEIYQAQIDIQQNQTDLRQNDIMRVLTVVTSIFFPLSLITGWYGMNFVNMPELEWPFGYAAVTVMSVVIVVGCIVVFKRKKFF